VYLKYSSSKADTKPAPAPASRPQSATAQVTAQVTPPPKPVEAPKSSSETTAKPPPPTSTNDADDTLAIELEKRKRRAERFGIPLADSAKAIERAKRFGENTTSTTEESKKEARGKKFKSQVWKKGGEKPAEATKPAVKKVLDDPLEAEKAKKRAERFGGGNEAKKVKT
jgi:SAP domain-containing ribonucleoprotein